MEKENINFRLIGIEVNSKSMSPMPPIEMPTQFFFEITVEIRVIEDRKLVAPYVYVKVRGNDETIELAAIGVSHLFEIDNFDQAILKNEEGNFIIPPELDATIKPVAISTTRGILFSELRGTYLHNAVIPVIYLNQLAPKISEK